MFKRIAQQLQQITNERFGILYGYGVEDSFLNDKGIEVNIHQSLYEELKLLGYEHIVFSSPHKALFYLDTQSKEFVPGQVKEDKTPLARHMSGFVDGPLGQYLYLRPEKKEREAPQQSLKTMGDPFLIKRLHNLMIKQESQKTAIVISQAETMLTEFTAQRMLAGYMGEWFRLPEGNHNLCLLIFSAMNKGQLLQLSSNLPVPEIRDQISNDSSGHSVFISEIAGPEKDEVQRLIYNLKEMGKLIEEDDVKEIAELIHAEGGNLHRWLRRLKTLEKIDLASLRTKGWFRVYKDQSIPAWEKLQQLTGLNEVKERISEIKAWLQIHSADPKRDKYLPNLHMIFMGNPGTGKTTVARLFGEILFEIRFLKRGHLIEATGKDLISDYVGGTAIKTNGLIDQALDGVLFIDEAYVLAETDRGGFGQEAVETLLTRLENDRSRLVVLLAGYPSRMRHFLDSNPGISRRFPKDNIFSFPDFEQHDLKNIFLQMLQERNLSLDTDAINAIDSVILGLFSQRDETFGNAGEMRNLVESLDRRRAIRIQKNKVTVDTPIIEEDISTKYRSFLVQEPPSVELILSELDQLTGLGQVKNHIKKLVYQLKYEQLRQQVDPTFEASQKLQHMVFVGNPGTGKTTVARLVGKIYHSLGLLRKGHCVEVARADLVAGYVGQTALKTTEKIKDALDGVLFIDEAYSLTQYSGNDYGQECVDALVKSMEDYRHRLVVIVAGYTAEMGNFINSNPGLSSRFSDPLPFEDFSESELRKILEDQAKNEKYILDPLAIDMACESLNSLKGNSPRQFGNARSVKNIFQQMKSSLAMRVVQSDIHSDSDIEKKEMITVLPEDVPMYSHLKRAKKESFPQNINLWGQRTDNLN
ncbi:MAG: AAA family ATPase [Anaerolineales bacterium]|jgi:SpoVK/Ycf46/Vps4 family AAA+-type ATPase